MIALMLLSLAACHGSHQVPYADTATTIDYFDSTGTDWSVVDVGEQGVCGIHTDSTVDCWGAVPDPPAGAFAQVAVGNASACARTTDGTVQCWGSDVTAPDGTFADIDGSGDDEFCGITDAGAISCWGDGDLPPPPDGTFTHVAVDRGQAVAITSDGALILWGKDDLGWDAEHVNSGPWGKAAIGIGICALDGSGSIHCWPYDWSEVWYGTAPAGPFDDLSLYDDEYCALDPSGAAWCRIVSAVESTDGQPVAVDGGPFTSISVGAYQSCGVRADHTLRCWMESLNVDTGYPPP